MALFADVLDHMEWKTGFRSDGLAMSVYNIIAVAMVGICTGVFNGLLSRAGYMAPEILDGVTVAAEQTAAVKNVITFGFVGLEVFTGVILVGLLFFLNVEQGDRKETGGDQGQTGGSVMDAIRLRTEHLVDPMGVDFTAPTLYWNCRGGERQTAYQIVAEDDTGTKLWDSGKVPGSAMRAVWGGAPVQPETKVLWRVRLWDEADREGPWASASFETGIDTWRGKRITGDYRVNRKQRYPVDCFRKRSSAEDIRKARLYITACGLYEARLNGVRVGNFVLAPGITDYRKRVQYQTYDVTTLLKEGENTLTVHLADGWYRGSCGAWGLRNQYGTQTKLLAQLEVLHTDGSRQTVAADASWDWSDDGPIRFADNQDGEVVNAADVLCYRGKARETRHPVVPSCSNNVPVTEHERLKPTRITTPSGKTVLDFGQNIAGYVEFTLRARAGQRVFLGFGELLDEAGEFTQKNIQCASKRTPPAAGGLHLQGGGESLQNHLCHFWISIYTDGDGGPVPAGRVCGHCGLLRSGAHRLFLQLQPAAGPVREKHGLERQKQPCGPAHGLPHPGAPRLERRRPDLLRQRLLSVQLRPHGPKISAGSAGRTA